MNQLSDRTKYILYAAHAIWVWYAVSVQGVHIIINRSAEDVVLALPIGMLLSELVALPLSCSSKYGIWGWCHRVGAVLWAIVLVGVLAYR